MADGFNLADYVTGAESIEPSDFNGPEDGTYQFEVTDIYVKDGSQANPDSRWIFVEYQLDTGRKYNELFTLPKDPERPTDKEQQTIGRYLSRLMTLGVERNQVNTVNAKTLIGRAGTLTLRTTTNRQSGREYQNISKLVVDEPGEVGGQAVPGFQVGGAPQTSKANPFAAR